MGLASLSSFSIVSSSPATQSKLHLPQHTLPIKHLPSLNRHFRRLTLRCRCSTARGSTGPGETESKTILDAFFLGRAIGEVLSERLESTLGEVISTIGRLQAEQQKQVQEFEEEVLDRAKKAKEKAARETWEAQGLVPKPATPNSDVNAVTFATEPPSPPNATSAYPNSNGESDSPDEDTPFGLSI
ncbi:unnamed protein product [Cuscuta epithymum]|uniref:Uncharacterized protein n=1 Tax=Cuscuta epithymum TaxID=186058 RepID=A0AAV0CH15_9ASTE|nr:unnamed protein product [Cuscuta epithymum]